MGVGLRHDREAVADRRGRRGALVLVALLTVAATSFTGAGVFGGHAAAAPSPRLTFGAPVTVDGSNDISGLSCPSPSLCVAVDTGGNIVTSTNPTGGAAAWSAVNVPNAFLEGVTCPTTTLCVASGDQGQILTSTNPTGGASAWTAVRVPATITLHGPSCPSPTFCAFADDSSSGGAVLISTNPTGGATAWTATTLPLNNPAGIACPTPSLCVVTDSLGTLVTSTNPTGGNGAWVSANIGATQLGGISCASSSLCVAAGSGATVYTSTNPRGSSANFWTSAAIDVANNFVDGLSCASTAPAFCAATDNVGNVLSSSDPATGASSWVTQSVRAGQFLGAISCPTNDLCIAVAGFGQIVAGTAGAGAPTVSAISPAQGPTAGGTSVTLTGTGFSISSGGTGVMFGTTAATSVSCSSATTCTATAPSGAPTVVNITVTVGGLTSAAAPYNNYTFLAPVPPPTVTALSPAQGPAGGGTAVTITGTGFATAAGATQVSFGRNAAATVACSGPTSCVATSPPGVGPQIVIVTVAQQTSSGSSASTFRYLRPRITGIAPTNGSSSGGTAVTITGLNFDTAPGTTQVAFGGVPAATLSCSSATTCVATSPPGSGAVFVTATEGPITTPAASAVSFTYVAPPVAPISCGATITQSVTLTADLGPCPGNGLVVAASGITLDLAGHRVFGGADQSDNRVGIQLANVTQVTLTGSADPKSSVTGDVDGFATGVSIDGGSHNNVTKLVVHDNIGLGSVTSNRGDGIAIGSVSASDHNVISNTVVQHNGVFDGIGIFSALSKGNQILNSKILDNNIGFTPPNSSLFMFDDGINLGSGIEGSNATTISGNTVSRNGHNGIDACSEGGGEPCVSDDNVMTNNVVQANGTAHIDAQGINISVILGSAPNPFPATNDLVSGNTVLDNLGIGIFVNNPGNTVTDNVALGNATDSSELFHWGGHRYDIYDNDDCLHSTYHRNTFDTGEAFPDCTMQNGTAVSPSSATGTHAAPNAGVRAVDQPGFQRGSGAE